MNNVDTLLEDLLPASLARLVRQPEPPPGAVAEACGLLDAALAALTPFVPSPVVDLQLADPGPRRIDGRYINGTVLVADLSGFTALSSQLALAGRQGSEEVSVLINQLFGALIDEVYRRGGGVIKFGGDALTVLFDGGRLGGGHAGLACAAALAMQARMEEFAAVPTSRGTFCLKLRIAVHSGNMFAVEVGDQAHTELIVTGRAVNVVTSVQQGAAPGEVVVSTDTLLRLKNAQAQPKLAGLHVLQGLQDEPEPPERAAPWRPGTPGPATLQALLDRICALRPYLPHGLPSRFVQQDLEAGEFRPVTVMFASIYPFSRLLTLLEIPALMEHDTSLVGQVLNTYYTRIQTAVHQYGGSINKVDMATFGDRLMVLFGAPTAHEDDPLRAAHAALAIRSEVKGASSEVANLLRDWTAAHPEQRAMLRVISLALRQRIGISNGTVFAGIVGSARRHEYTVMGETVNLAARLMAESDGHVLVTSGTQRLLRQQLDALPLPPISFKGFTQPVPVFRIVQSDDGDHSWTAPRHAAPMIGRDEELHRLLDRGRRALAPGDQAGLVVGLSGEPGVGKSRLAEELCRRLREEVAGLVVVTNACQSYEQTNPYAAVSRVLRRLLAPPEAERELDADAALRQLEQLVPAWSRFAALLGPLLNLPLPETSSTRFLAPQQRHERLHELIVSICLASAQRQPLAIVVDDLQWTDPSSAALIEQLAAQLAGQPLLLVLIYRSTPGMAEPWRALDHGLTVRLGELTREDGEVLLRALLQGELPHELRALVERTQGRPFFLEEMVRYLLETGALQRDGAGGYVCARQIDQATVPIQVEQLVTARLDRLGEDTRVLVQVAAVIGQQFSAALLAAVAPHDALVEQLDEAATAALIQLDAGAFPPSYCFAHAIVRDVAYGSLLFARRRELHAAIAAAISEIYAAEIDEHQAVLAQHYLRAERLDQAFAHLLLAAQHAQARYAHAEALTLYQQALAIAPWHDQEDEQPPLETATALYEHHGDVLAQTGDYAQARQSYTWLLNIFKRSHARTSPEQHAALQRKIGRSYELQGDLGQALRWLVRAEATVAGGGAPIEHARVLSDSGWVFFRQGKLDDAQRYLERAALLIGPGSEYDEQARLLNRLGGVAWARGETAVSQRYVEQSLRASEQSGNLAEQANALENLGNLTGHQGLLDESIDYYRRAIEINERIGNRRALAISANNIGYALLDSGDPGQALDFLNRALHVAIELRDTYTQMMALTNLGLTLTVLDTYPAAERRLRESQAIAKRLRQSSQQIENHVALAELALRRGDLARAVEEHQRGRKLVVEQDNEEFGRLERVAARIALARGDQAGAIALLETSEALFAQLGAASEVGRTRQLLAEARQMASRAV